MKAPRPQNRTLKYRRLGAEQSPWEDLYHRILRLSWPTFIVHMLLVYVFLAIGFAFLYQMAPGSVAHINDGDFFNYFAFSVQTMSTLGYGYYYPQTNYAHTIVFAQTTIGLFFTAGLTGLFFAKFSRPQARVVFSDNILLMKQNGSPVLCLRLGNFRTNRIFEGRARMTLMRDEVTTEGERMRRLLDLKLLRDETPLFALSWTLIHPIDNESPFQGLSIEKIRSLNWDVFVNFIGIDEDMEADIVAHTTYTMDKIVPARKFKDMITLEKDTRVIDFRQLNEIEHT